MTRSYRWVATVLLLAIGCLGGTTSAGARSAGAHPALRAGQIVYGRSMDAHHHVHNRTSLFSTSDHFSWRAAFVHTAVAHNISRLTFTSTGQLVSTRHPFSGSDKFDIAWGDFKMSEFMSANAVPGPGTYVMRYVDKHGQALAEGTFTIK